MAPINDIRGYKAELREYYKAKRREMEPALKDALDQQILERVLRLYQYRSCKQLLTYVSTSIEVNTRALIIRALQDGKRVAVPRCVPGTREMEFYYIASLSELSPGSFAVDEPNPKKARKVTDFSGALCIVPALCFDNRGYRLGYGKGYYDRFLSGFEGPTAGLCYSSGIRRHLFYGRFDRRVDVIVTERYIKRVRP